MEPLRLILLFLFWILIRIFFCSQKETVFHAFMYCFRLKPLFVFVQEMCVKFNEIFFPETFIFGFKYARKKCIVSIIEFYFWASEIGNLYESEK